MKRAKPRNRVDDNKQLQIKVALIGGVFAVLAALIGGVFTVFGHGGNGDASQPTQVSVTNSPAPDSLDPAAKALIDPNIPCQPPSTSPVSSIGDVTINSPMSGGTVSRHGTVSGTAKLSGGDYLYFFVYAPGACDYYFQPGRSVGVGRDGFWQVPLYLEGNNPGDKVDLYAVMVDPEANRILVKLLSNFAGNGSPYVRMLPSGARYAHINVELSY